MIECPFCLELITGLEDHKCRYAQYHKYAGWP